MLHVPETSDQIAMNNSRITEAPNGAPVPSYLHRGSEQPLIGVTTDAFLQRVMDRFPALRVGFFESGLGWMPYWIDRLDEHFEVMGHHTPWLKRRPSEIFAEQCFVSMEADEAAGLQWMAEKGLAGSILWGTDYPHFDSTYPGAFDEAERSFDATGPEIAGLVVGENPRRFMGSPG